MKKIFFLLVFSGSYLFSQSQIIKSVTDKIKNRVETKVNNKVETTINEKIDKAVDSTFSKTGQLITDIVTASPDSLKTMAPEALQNWRSKFVNEGEWSTEAIKFDPVTSGFTPESQAILKDMAALLNENSNLKMNIIVLAEKAGDQTELERSDSLANSIKLSLVNQFGIDPGRMTAEGKIETGINENLQTKNVNRKVRFVKL
jgi:hypothetical protein